MKKLILFGVVAYVAWRYFQSNAVGQQPHPLLLSPPPPPTGEPLSIELPIVLTDGVPYGSQPVTKIGSGTWRVQNPAAAPGKLMSNYYDIRLITGNYYLHLPNGKIALNVVQPVDALIVYTANG
jgi:hypothetical protein